MRIELNLKNVKESGFGGCNEAREWMKAACINVNLRLRNPKVSSIAEISVQFYINTHF